MSDRTCATCRFFAPEERECRQKAPQLFLQPTPNGVQGIGIFPPTRADKWCGEHRTADESP